MKFQEQKFEIAPAGLHTGVLYRIIDLGTQKEMTQWGEKVQPKATFFFELPDEKRDDGKPFIITQRYTLVMGGKSRIVKDMKAWKNVDITEKDFDVAKFFHSLIGQGCNLNIVHSPDGKFANIDGISPLKKGENVPAPVNEAFFFDLEHYDAALFAKLSENVQNAVKQSPEYQDLAANGVKKASISNAAPTPASDAILNDEVPF